MSSEPRDFNARFYVFQLVLRYFCETGFLYLRLPDRYGLRWLRLVHTTERAGIARSTPTWGRLRPRLLPRNYEFNSYVTIDY